MSLPERYHAHMRFRVTTGAWRGEVGTIEAVDFGAHTIDLRMGNKHIPSKTFALMDVELIDHDNCTAPDCRTNPSTTKEGERQKE